MGAAQLGPIEESESEEQHSLIEDSAKSDSNFSQSEREMEPSLWKISKIIAADDQILNIQVLKSYFAKLYLTKQVQYAYNGQQVIDFVKEIFLGGLENRKTSGEVYKPINLLILDFQMPMKNGIQVVKEVKEFLRTQAESGLDLVIEEPTYVFLTAFATTKFVNHAHSLGVQHVFEKPMAIEELTRLLEQSQDCED